MSGGTLYSMTLELTLKQADEICSSAESAVIQVRLVDDGQGTAVNTLNTPPNLVQGCSNCGRQHDTQWRKLCPAFGKICRNAINETTLQRSVGARAETREPSPWTRPRHRIHLMMTRHLHSHYQSIAWMTHNSLHSVSGQAATSDFRWIRGRNVMSYQ